MSQAEIDAITESGGPKPQFAGNEVLTATNLNLATRHWVTTEVPGDNLGNDGDIAFVAGDAAPNSELPGIGGWAEIKEVSGTATSNVFEDSEGMEWKVYKWVDNGSITFKTNGLAEVLAVGSGGSGTGSGTYRLGGGAGGVTQQYAYFSANQPEDVVVGKGLNSNAGESSYVGDVVGVFGGYGSTVSGGSTGGASAAIPPYTNYVHGQGNYGNSGGHGGGGGAGGQGTSTSGGPGRMIDFDGKGEVEYGRGGEPEYKSVDAPGIGQGGYAWAGGAAGPYAGGDGILFIRVPKANADSVTETLHAWISYATVENGVVTKVTKTPDNKPYTVSTNEVECDASVQEGYLYENGEFTAPEPDYSEEIEALTARLEELRNV